MTWLLVALGAAVGGAIRHACAVRWDADLPRGTFAVNVVGSGLIGVFAALSLGGQAWALLATGLCGGLTTFSSLAVQSVDAPPARGLAYAATTVVAAVAACALGFALAS